MARFFKIRIHTFSIGFGPPFLYFHDKKKVKWQMAIIPFGGYVQIDDLLHKRPAIQRILVAIAGPLSNFILAFILFFSFFAIKGWPTFVPIVNDIVQDFPAQKAGIQKNDVIIKIGETNVKNHTDIIKAIKDYKGKTTNITVNRSNNTLTLPIDLKEKYKIGVLFITENKKISLFESVKQALLQIILICKQIIEAFSSIFENTGSIFSIKQAASQSFQEGIWAFLSFTGALSVHLGLINLFPIPMLDGGHVLLVGLEKILGKKMSKKVYGVIIIIGFMLIMGLLISGIINDLKRIWDLKI